MVFFSSEPSVETANALPAAGYSFSAPSLCFPATYEQQVASLPAEAP
jgi:hypothetical protein